MLHIFQLFPAFTDLLEVRLLFLTQKKHYLVEVLIDLLFLTLQLQLNSRQFLCSLAFGGFDVVEGDADGCLYIVLGKFLLL